MQRINMQKLEVSSHQGFSCIIIEYIMNGRKKCPQNRIKNRFFSKSGAWKIALFSPAGS
jgi:hypothetical protein